MEALPHELVLEILRYLTPDELECCRAVCKAFLVLASDASLWRAHCYTYWRYKQKSARMKKILSAPRNSFLCSSLSEHGGWRNAFWTEYRNGFRQEITLDELCDATWMFQFKALRPESYMISAHSRFLRDGTYIHHFPEYDKDAIELPWRFVIADNAGYKGLYVQVDDYPPLSVARTPDWGWVLQNSFVKLYTVDNELEELLKREKQEAEAKKQQQSALKQQPK